MHVEDRDDNVVFVSFNARPAARNCDDCPFRRCCTCAHWDRDVRSCTLGARAGAAPVTDDDDWCGRWEPRGLELLAVER